MSGRRDDSLLLDDIVDAAERLVDLGRRFNTRALGEDRDTDEMVLFNVLVLGEACKRLQTETRARFPGIPWAEMARMRDVVIHHYEGLDWVVIGQVIGEDLPSLLPDLREIRDALRADANGDNRS